MTAERDRHFARRRNREKVPGKTERTRELAFGANRERLERAPGPGGAIDDGIAVGCKTRRDDRAALERELLIDGESGLPAAPADREADSYEKRNSCDRRDAL